jgi:hypothetical protein
VEVGDDVVGVVDVDVDGERGEHQPRQSPPGEKPAEEEEEVIDAR